LRSVGLAATAALAAASLTFAQQMQMKQPEMKTIKGTVIDLTCASKGHAMTGMWANSKDDHMMEDGTMTKGCGAMCLGSGQPAGLFDGKTVSAVFACNPAMSLSALSGKDVEVQGFWAGGSVKTFVPVKVRQGAGDWADVKCSEMH
jgi:hypothetical protein